MSISQNFPAIDPTLCLNFQGARRLDPRISFTRASTATYVGKDGLIKTAAADEARFDHDPETGESLGLLIEESRTNYVANSTAVQGGNLQPQYLTVSSVSNITSPDGTTNGVVRYTTSGGPGAYRLPTNWAAGAPNTPYTGSIWVRAVNTSASFTIDVIDWNTTGFTVGEQWTRVSVTAERSDVSYRFFDVNASDNQDLYLWGPQIEQGNFPTSYIPTSGSQFTRQSDNASITGTNFTDFYNQSEGTLSSISSIDYLGIDNQPTAVLFNDSVNFIGIGYGFGGSSSGTTGSWINYGGDQFYASGGNILSNVPFKQSITYKTNDAIACVDGTLSSSDNNVILAFPNSLHIGKSYGGYNMRRGHIRSITYYPERLTNTQLQNLTK